MLPRYRDRAESQTSVWDGPSAESDEPSYAEASSDSLYDEFPEADPAVITDLMLSKHGAKSSVVAHVKELRVPSPLPPSEYAMKVQAVSEEEPETNRRPSNAPVAREAMYPERADSSLDFDTFNPDDSDLVPVVHQQSVRKYPASFPEPARRAHREPTYDDVRPFEATDDHEMDGMSQGMRRIYTPHGSMAPYALVSESLMPQIIGVDIVTTPPPAPTSWRHKLAMAAIWAVVITSGGGAIGYSRGDFTKQDLRYTAACAQQSIAEIAHVSQARTDRPTHHPRVWQK
jgi:hypothetical protein